MPITGRSVSTTKAAKTDMDIKLDKVELVMRIFNQCRIGEVVALAGMAADMKKQRK